MKKKLLLALLPVLALSSCGDNSYYGTFQFMLGRKEDPATQIGIQFQLTDEDFKYHSYQQIKDTVKTYNDILSYNVSSLEINDIIKCERDSNIYNNYQFYQYVEDELTHEKALEPIGQTRPTTGEEKTIQGAKKFNAKLSVGNTVGTMSKEISKAISAGISGYYTSTTTECVDAKYGKRFNVGIAFTEDCIHGIEYLYTCLDDYITDAFPDEPVKAKNVYTLMRNIFDALTPQIRPEMTQYFIASYTNGSTLTLKIPVSINDFLEQFTWYGTYTYFDPNILAKITSFKTFIDNFQELFATAKAYDLTSHREKHIPSLGDNEPIVELPGGETKQGEKRIGTVPTVTTSYEKAKGNMDEADKMNEYYASEFSNTWSYKKVGEKLEHQGTITRKTLYSIEIDPETQQEVVKETYQYYYYNFDNTITSSSTNQINTKLMFKDSDDLYKTETDVTIVLDPNKHDVNLGTPIIGVNKAGQTESVNIEKTFFRNPFVFRKFHSLPLSLSK